MEKLVVSQLQKWHEEGKHREIIDAVEAVPDGERDFERVSLLARAYQNVRRYDKAYELLCACHVEGKGDALWNWRMGLSEYTMRAYGDAVNHLELAVKLGDDDPETTYYLEKARKQVKRLERRGMSYEEKLKCIENEYAGAGLGKYWNVLKNMVRNSIDMELTPCEESEMPLGASKIGGLPDLPGDVDWFAARGGEPAMFVAQINFAETKPFDLDGVLPESGILYLFYGMDHQWGFDPKDADCKRVYYYDGDMSALERKSVPESLPEDCRFTAAKPAFAAMPNVPDFWSSLVDFNDLTDEENDSYWELRDELDGKINKLLGHSNNIQNGMELECELVTNGLYCGNETGYKDPRAAALRENAPGWRLLLQIDSNDDQGMMWGDDGRIYLWIREDALRGRDFESAWLILQCY